MGIATFDMTGFNLGLNFWGLVIALVCAYTVTRISLDKELKKILIEIYLLTAATILTYIFAIIFNGVPGKVYFFANVISEWINYMLTFALIYMYVRLVEYQLGLSEGRDLHLGKYKITQIIGVGNLGIYFVLLISQFTGIVYYIDRNNVYHRGPIFWLFQVYVLLVVLVMFISSKPIWGGVRAYERKGAMFDFGVIIVGVIIQWKFNALATNYIAIIIIALHYMLQRLEHESKERVEREERIVEQKEMLRQATAKIMLSQIQPHFLYNTLNTIYYLCETNPSVAQEAVSAFSEYLRANLNSLKQDELIPIEQELHHVETYLWIEKLRFEERLDSEVTIDHPQIKVPVLSIQPLVENAVKHGLCAKPEGGTVWVYTEEGENEYRVIVEDDGIGFENAEKYNTKSAEHTGVYNVMNRLDIAGASLEYQKRADGGTKAIVHVKKV